MKTYRLQCTGSEAETPPRAVIRYNNHQDMVDVKNINLTLKSLCI